MPASASLAFERREPGSWLVWGLRLALALCAIAALLIPGWDAFLRLSMAGVSLGGLAGALLLPAIPNHDARRMRYVEAIWSGMFLLHFLGHAFDLYSTMWYDKALHAGGGGVAALAAYWLARSTTLLWDRGHARPFRVLWVALSAAVVAGVAVEIVEYGADVAFGTGTQEHPGLAPIHDTMTDLVAETAIGLAVGGAVALRVRQENAAPHQQHRSPSGSAAGSTRAPARAPGVTAAPTRSLRGDRV